MESAALKKEKAVKECSWPAILRYHAELNEALWCGLRLSDFACRREIMG